MALQTMRAVINITLAALMARVRLRLQVAIGATEHRKVALIGVALRALALLAAVIGGELAERGVRETGAAPIYNRREMATGTGVRKELGIHRRTVSRRGCRVVVRDVTGIAIGGRSREFAAYVAIQAGSGGVLAYQRKANVVVIECRAGPIRRRMAQGAVFGITQSDVVRIGGRVITGNMTGIAIRRECCILIISMASEAGRGRVFASQWEFRLTVIERRAGPIHGGVAQRAIFRESRGDVIRIGSRVVFV